MLYGALTLETIAERCYSQETLASRNHANRISLLLWKADEQMDHSELSFHKRTEGA